MAGIARKDYRALAEMRYSIRMYLAFSEDRARAAGLDPAQHQLLLAVEGLPADLTPTIGVIAARLGIRHHSAVELASRAERLGLVKRTRVATDQRRVVLAVTRRGKDLLARLSVEHRKELRRLAPALVKALQAIIKGRS
jgi:DNA-binding MarR family transcriptional regulator